ncbi:MAG TPA: response regulator [Terracidiphilus sp.]
MMRSHTILCVDDEALGLQIRKAILEMAGYQVLTALDGNTAIGLFERNSVDVVVLDYLMPEMDGGQVAAAMRRVKPEVPILLHSACVDLPQETIDIVDSSLAKGEGPELLLNRLQGLIEASQFPMGSNR